MKGNTRGAGKSSWRRLFPAGWCPRHTEGVPEAGGGAGGEGEEEEGGGGEGEEGGGGCGWLGQKSRRSRFGSEHWPGHHHFSKLNNSSPSLSSSPFLSGCHPWKPREEHFASSRQAGEKCQTDAGARHAQEILSKFKKYWRNIEKI